MLQLDQTQGHVFGPRDKMGTYFDPSIDLMLTFAFQLLAPTFNNIFLSLNISGQTKHNTAVISIVIHHKHLCNYSA